MSDDEYIYEPVRMSRRDDDGSLMALDVVWDFNEYEDVLYRRRPREEAPTAPPVQPQVVYVVIQSTPDGYVDEIEGVFTTLDRAQFEAAQPNAWSSDGLPTEIVQVALNDRNWWAET